MNSAVLMVMAVRALLKLSIWLVFFNVSSSILGQARPPEVQTCISDEALVLFTAHTAYVHCPVFKFCHFVSMQFLIWHWFSQFCYRYQTLAVGSSDLFSKGFVAPWAPSTRRFELTAILHCDTPLSATRSFSSRFLFRIEGRVIVRIFSQSDSTWTH